MNASLFRLLLCLLVALVFNTSLPTATADDSPVPVAQQKKKQGKKRNKKKQEKESEDAEEDEGKEQVAESEEEGDGEEMDADDEADEEDEEAADEDESDEDEEDGDEDEDEKDGDEKSAKKPEKKPQVVKMSGAFVASKATEVSIRPEEWSTLRVVSAADHGDKVRKGATIVELETEKLDLAIEDFRHDVDLARISLKQAEMSVELLERSTPLKIAAAEESEKRTAEELKRFMTVGKEARVESAEYSLQSSQNFLSYQQEELKQLEAMYEADDLTEETEEIVLLRTRNSVKAAEFSLGRAKRSYDRDMNYSLPRDELDMEMAVKKAAIELERARATLPATMDSAKLKLEKQKLALQKLESKLKRLLDDRDAMTVKSPARGVVYYGQCKNGKWSDASSYKSVLAEGGTLKSRQVFMTIVSLRPVTISTTVTEKDMRHVSEGAEVTVKPTAFPDMEWDGEVESVSSIPVGSGKFAVKVSVDLPDDADAIVPGMTCSVELTVEDDGEDDGEEDDKEE